MINRYSDPYRSLFFVGLISSVIGSGLWPAYQFHLISFFPRQEHGHLMFFGFLWSFIAGFLMTAIPRMTQTKVASLNEKIFAVVLVFAQWVISFVNWPSLAQLIYVAQLLFLSFFVLQRYLQKRRMPFPGFLFFPFALLTGVGAFFQLANYSLVAGQGLVLNLICGVGSRLVPPICRVPQAIDPTVSEKKQNLEMLFFAVWLNISFVFEILDQVLLAYLLRTFFLIVFSIRYFKILKVPMVRSYLGWGIRVSLILLILGYLFAGIFISFKLAILHLALIGGLALITIMVATRVTAAHGGVGLDEELRPNVILPIWLLISAAAFVRIAVLNNFTSHSMTLSALLFIGAVALWFKKFRKILM